MRKALWTLLTTLAVAVVLLLSGITAQTYAPAGGMFATEQVEAEEESSDADSAVDSGNVGGEQASDESTVSSDGDQESLEESAGDDAAPDDQHAEQPPKAWKRPNRPW